MLFAFAAVLAASQPALAANTPTPGRTAWIVATVGHSEFCPAGNVRLDLRTGRYEFTPRAPRRVCDEPGLERPVRTGRLGSKRLAILRAASLRVMARGFQSEACRDGTQPKDEIIISNGGTPIILLTTGAGTGSALEDLTCWSEAATALHDLLDETFDSTE
jgi:hypothetical protein